MSASSRIRHSIVGRSVRRVIHTGYHLRNAPGKPVNYFLPGGIELKLFPEGEIAEFLWVQRFFEKTELALVAAYLKPGMTVIDAGANIGVYSIFAEKLIGQSGNVWAVEPALETFQRLQKNLQLNHCKRVRAVRLALGAQRNTLMQLKNDPGFGDAYCYLAPSAAADPESLDGEWVPVTTLDTFSQQNGIGQVDFLKVDVEGAEYFVFQGGQQFLRSSPNICIMFESDPEWFERSGCKPQDCFELLRELGFGLYVWHNRTRRWRQDEEELLNATMIWAARESSRLPPGPAPSPASNAGWKELLKLKQRG